MRNIQRALPGLASGLVGGLCCIVGAFAVGLGLAGSSFAVTLMDRYQPWVMAVSLLLLAGGVVQTARHTRAAGQRAASGGVGRTLVRHAGVMGVAYAVTLALTVAVSRLVVSG